MPTVPQIREPRIASAAIPGVRVPTEAPIEDFGGGQADRTVDLRQMQKTAVAVYQEQKHNADQIAVNDADVQLQGVASSLLYDDKTGVLNRRGKNAFGAPDEVQDKWGKAVSDIMGGLTGDLQKRLFQRRALVRWNSVNSEVQRHVATERHTLDADTTEGLVTGYIQDSVKNFDKQDVVDHNAQSAHAALMDYGTRNGLSEDQSKAKAAEAVSHIYASSIERLLAEGRDLDAKEVYKLHKDDLVGSQAVSVDRALHEGTKRGEAHRQVDGILQTGATEKDSLEKTDKIKDPEVRDQARQYVKEHFSDLRSAELNARMVTFQQAGDFVEQTKGRAEVPPALKVGLTVQENEALDHRREQLQKGIRPQTNWTRFYDLMGLASSEGSRDNFASMNLLKDRWQLADSQFEDLTRLQASIRNKETTADSKLGHYRTTAEAINNNLLGAGINPHNQNPENQTKVNNFRNQVYGQIREQEEATGKPVKAPEVQAIIDNLLVKGITARHWLWPDTEKRVFELNPDESLELQVKDIPRVERAQIEAVLKSRNLSVTDQRVLQLYSAKVKSLRPEE